ncbi:MAG: hypothetical protein OEO23_11810 [Gemmatimonadota bacterium]|nr:hypothetical protein [Gemmatimonadota bacterium]
MTESHSRLRRIGGSAAALGALYTAALVWIAVGQEAPDTWDPTDAAWSAPMILLAAQVLFVGGLMALVFALRGVARALARLDAEGSSGVPLGSDELPIESVTVLPLAFAAAATTGILAAARGVMEPFSLFLWTAGMPAVVYAGLVRSSRAPVSGTPSPPPAEAHRLVSRLRGVSLLTTAVGALFFFVSGSLVLTALLPYAMLGEVPRSGPVDVAGSGTWPAVRAYGEGSMPTPETSTVATEAGTAIHALFFVGSPVGPGHLERPPIRAHGAWWAGPAPQPLGLAPQAWASGLASALSDSGVGADTRTLLAGLANHPANLEFDRLASAVSADVTGARLADLEAQPTAAFELPVPRYVELWNGVRGRIAGAVWIAHEGDRAEARRRIASVERLGWLLHNDGPATLDAVMGMQIFREAGVALASLDAYSGVGDAGSHPPAAGPRRKHAQGLPPGPAGISDRAGWLAAHQAALEDPALPRSLRFEAFALAQTFRPCRSVSAILWDPPSTEDAWSRRYRESLATRESEASLAALLAHGWLGTRAGIEGWGWLPRVLAIALADRPAVTHCAPLAATQLSRG